MWSTLCDAESDEAGGLFLAHGSSPFFVDFPWRETAIVLEKEALRMSNIVSLNCTLVHHVFGDRHCKRIVLPLSPSITPLGEQSSITTSIVGREIIAAWLATRTDMFNELRHDSED